MDYEKNEPVRRRRRKRKPPYGLYITICFLGIGILVLGFAYLSELARNGHLPGLGGKLFLMGEEEQAAEETFAPEEEEAFADAYEAYEAFLSEIRQDPEGYLKSIGASTKAPEDIRYQYGYVDEDEVPELFIGTGREQEAGITVYTALAADGYAVKKVGTFSQYGILYYVPHENVMISHCGDAGTYYVVYHGIRQGRAILERILKQAPGEEDMAYFCGITWEEDFTGDSESFRGDPKLSGLRDEEMRETESEEFFRLQGVYENGHDRQLCAYADMIPLGRNSD